MRPCVLVRTGTKTSKFRRIGIGTGTDVNAFRALLRLADPGSARGAGPSVVVRGRYISTTAGLRQAKYFTASPFSRSDEIPVSDRLSIRRELGEGADFYGARRYLLVPRIDGDGDDPDPGRRRPPGAVLASLNANKNILFGARLHLGRSSSTDDADVGDGDDYLSKYLAACGSLFDVAREDAAINGQQVQALAALNGLCAWVEGCLTRDGEGSEVLGGLMHGEQRPNLLQRRDARQSSPPAGKRANQRIRDASARLILKNEAERTSVVEAVRAIATGRPRPGHSVVGAGTYRDGEGGWTALAREYAEMAASVSAPDSPDGVPSTAEEAGGRPAGPEEVALYGSRGGVVTRIEHLAHTAPDYLREAGGAMARMYFV